jgi:hypothetical protein
VLRALHKEVLPVYRWAPGINDRWTRSELRREFDEVAAEGWLVPRFAILEKAIRNGATDVKPFRDAFVSVAEREHLRTPWFLDWAIAAVFHWECEKFDALDDPDDVLCDCGEPLDDEPPMVEVDWLRIRERHLTDRLKMEITWLLYYQVCGWSFRDLAMVGLELDGLVVDSRPDETALEAEMEEVAETVPELAKALDLPLRPPDCEHCKTVKASYDAVERTAKGTVKK